MKHLAPRLTLAVTIALAAACGDKSGSKDTTPAPAGGPPFDQAKVKAAVAALAVGDTQSCDLEGAATVGDAMGSQRAMMQADGGVEESFTCRASVLTDGRWECTWEVVQRSSGGGGGDPCGDDPCAGEGGGSAFQAIVQVNADGSLVAGQTACVAPG